MTSGTCFTAKFGCHRSRNTGNRLHRKYVPDSTGATVTAISNGEANNESLESENYCRQRQLVQ